MKRKIILTAHQALLILNNIEPSKSIKIKVSDYDQILAMSRVIL